MVFAKFEVIWVISFPDNDRKTGMSEKVTRAHWQYFYPSRPPPSDIPYLTTKNCSLVGSWFIDDKLLHTGSKSHIVHVCREFAMTSQLRPICLHILRILSYLESHTFVFIVLDSAIATTHSVNYRSDYHHVCICIVIDNWRDFWVNISVVIMRIDHWLVHRQTIWTSVGDNIYMHSII